MQITYREDEKLVIYNFMCEDCTHSLVCSKLSILKKFHQDAKKDLLITITMDGCEDFEEVKNDEIEVGEED